MSNQCCIIEVHHKTERASSLFPEGTDLNLHIYDSVKVIIGVKQVFKCT